MNRALLSRLIPALLLLAARPALAADPDTFSPVVSYQYLDTLESAPVISPIVSYQYFDWPGNENVRFTSSPNVSYFFRDNCSLTITGPATVNTNGNATYEAFLGAEDVTLRASFSFGQAIPTFAGIGGSTLFVSKDAPLGPLLLRASLNDPSGQFFSAPFTVNVVRSFLANAAASSRRVDGNTFEISLAGTTSGGVPPFTFRWDTNRDGSYDDKIGQTVSFTVESTGGTLRAALEVEDGAGAKARAASSVTFDKPPVAGQPERVKSKYDVGLGEAYGSDGHLFRFDTSRVPNGLLVITHGLYASGLDTWLRDLGQRAEVRLERDLGGRVPNVILYDWGEYSDPSGTLNYTRIAMAEALGLVATGAGVVSAAKTGLSEAAAYAAKEAFKDQIKGVITGAAFELFDKGVDAVTVRNSIARSAGSALAEWLWQNARTGLIDPDEPIHLIGHSAGGFVMGECALWLQRTPLPDGRIMKVDRVTMLDTPFPILEHLTGIAFPGVIEQDVSSLLGLGEFPSTQGVFPGPSYRHRVLGLAWKRLSWGDDGHGLAHRWYRRTVLPLNEADGPALDALGGGGFADSPFLSPSPAPRRVSNGMTSVVEQAVIGFDTFGNVDLNGSAYTLSEEADAGIFKMLTFPIGATALRFQYRFLSPGDGDFLSVNFTPDFNLYAGLDHALSRGSPMPVEIPLDALWGRTGELVFSLISRGDQNARLEISDIRFVISDDPDGDGLTNAQEQAYGSNPYDSDTDGDGLTDDDEVNVYRTNPALADSDGDGVPDGRELAAGTNPLSNASVFAIREMVRNAGSFTLRWTAKAGKTYRVHRSTTSDFAAYDVVSPAIAGVEPLTTYTDSTVGALNSPAVFYRVVTE